MNMILILGPVLIVVLKLARVFFRFILTIFS